MNSSRNDRDRYKLAIYRKGTKQKLEYPKKPTEIPQVAEELLTYGLSSTPRNGWKSNSQFSGHAQ